MLLDSLSVSVTYLTDCISIDFERKLAELAKEGGCRHSICICKDLVLVAVMVPKG